MSDFGVTKFADLSIADNGSGNAVIDMGAGDEFELVGVTFSSLDENDFWFV